MKTSEILDSVIQHCKTVPNALALVVCPNIENRNSILALFVTMHIHFDFDPGESGFVAEVGYGKIILRVGGAVRVEPTLIIPPEEFERL